MKSLSLMVLTSYFATTPKAVDIAEQNCRGPSPPPRQFY